jgi:NagD protein
MIRSALNQIEAHSATTAMAGDRMDTDVMAGMEAGLTTHLVLSGSTRREEISDFAYRPNNVVESISELIERV